MIDARQGLSQPLVFTLMASWQLTLAVAVIVHSKGRLISDGRLPFLLWVTEVLPVFTLNTAYTLQPLREGRAICWPWLPWWATRLIFFFYCDTLLYCHNTDTSARTWSFTGRKLMLQTLQVKPVTNQQLRKTIFFFSIPTFIDVDCSFHFFCICRYECDQYCCNITPCSVCSVCWCSVLPLFAPSSLLVAHTYKWWWCAWKYIQEILIRRQCFCVVSQPHLSFEFQLRSHSSKPARRQH